MTGINNRYVQYRNPQRGPVADINQLYIIDDSIGSVNILLTFQTMDNVPDSHEICTSPFVSSLSQKVAKGFHSFGRTVEKSSPFARVYKISRYGTSTCSL